MQNGLIRFLSKIYAFNIFSDLKLPKVSPFYRRPVIRDEEPSTFNKECSFELGGLGLGFLCVSRYTMRGNTVPVPLQSGILAFNCLTK